MTLYSILKKPIKQRKAYHYLGFSLLLPFPDIVIIQRDLIDTTGFFLFRYLIDGTDAGDTWHETLEEAKGQADFEYGDSIDEWIEIPEDVNDPLEYCLQQLRKK
jgi:hypothetical protein